MSGREGRPTAVVLPVTSTIPAENRARFVREAAVDGGCVNTLEAFLGKEHPRSPAVWGRLGMLLVAPRGAVLPPQLQPRHDLGHWKQPLGLCHSCNYTADSFRAI